LHSIIAGHFPSEGMVEVDNVKERLSFLREIERSNGDGRR